MHSSDQPETVRPDSVTPRSFSAAPSPAPFACLHHRFEAQAAAKPDAEALIVGYQRITYRELNARANRIAHRLRSLGVGPESLVGVYLDRSADLVASLLGVLKAGGAYVPLDPIYPSARIGFILQDAQLHTVVTTSSLHDSVRHAAASSGLDPACVCLDTDEQLAFTPDSNPPASAAPENLAYVLYAPGSADLKGVGIEHRQANAFITWAGDTYDARELGGVLACTSVCFDPSIMELFAPLSFGGRIILAENILSVRDLPAANHIRVMDTVPSVARELLRIGGFPPSLETLNLGGEPVPDDLVKQLYALPRLKRVYDQYGPTETTTVATSVLRTPREPATIGRSVSHAHIYLLDDNQSPVPIGAIGELCVGGEGVARGYWNRPDLTARKFLPDPFSQTPGARLFRTGDLCRYLADGRLVYVGRVDEQVNIEGRQLKLAEIESALRGHPSIGDALVMLREDVPGQPRIVAYVVPQPPPPRKPPSEAELNLAAELCRCLRGRLPHHLLPLLLVVFSLFTLLPGGRIERISLHAPGRQRSADTGVRSSLRTRTESGLARAWNRLAAFRQTGAIIQVALRSSANVSPRPVVSVTPPRFTVRAHGITFDVLRHASESRRTTPPAAPPSLCTPCPG